MKKAVEGITINMQSLNWTFGHPQGSLVGNYGQFDKKISFIVRKKTPELLNNDF